MPEFSQLVRARLQAQQVPAEHLDPDVLAAFAEHRLGESERTLALAHLSSCATCREVIALASQIEPDLPAAPGAAKAVPTLRRRFSVWRVGMIGALAVLAVSATVLLRIDKSHSTIATENLHVVEQVAPAAAPPAANFGNGREAGKPTSKAVPQVAEKKSERRDQRSQFASARPSAGVSGALTANAGASANGAAADLVTQSRSSIAPLQPAPSPGLATPAAPPPAQAQPALADEFHASNQNVQVQQQPPSTQAQQQQQPSSQVASQSETVEVTAAAPAVQQNGRVKSAPGQAAKEQTAQTMDAELRRVPAYQGKLAEPTLNKVEVFDGTLSQWSITADGKLQRRITPDNATSPATWQPVPVDSNVVFRVVNATGRDVWAGGNSGTLFHSTDDGEHWSRITPQSGDSKFEGDVISIRVAGQSNAIVRVLTSRGQSWISSDSGATWKIESR